MPGQSRKSKSKSYGVGVAGKPLDLLLPSGNICLVRRPGVRGLIKAGLLDSLDSLTSLVQADLIDSKDPKKQAQAAQQLMADPDRLEEGLAMIDKAVCFSVVEPKLLRPIQVDLRGNPVLDAEGKEIPLEADDRDPNALYVDDVDEEDKTFIFNFIVGGTRDIEQFRQATQGRMGGLSAGEDVPLSTE